MTQQQHPITPPPHLIEQWMQDHSTKYGLARKAAQWGADQELEACRMEIIDGSGLFYIDETSDRVRLAEDIWTARRSKPPSLKEQALKEIEELAREAVTGCNLDILERAIKSIPD